MKSFKEGDLVLLYDNKFLQHPGNFGMHWLGPYEVKNVTYGESVQLKELGGIKLKSMINDNQMKMYKNNRPSKKAMYIMYYSRY